MPLECFSTWCLWVVDELSGVFGLYNTLLRGLSCTYILGWTFEVIFEAGSAAFKVLFFLFVSRATLALVWT